MSSSLAGPADEIAAGCCNQLRQHVILSQQRALHQNAISHCPVQKFLFRLRQDVVRPLRTAWAAATRVRVSEAADHTKAASDTRTTTSQNARSPTLLFILANAVRCRPAGDREPACARAFVPRPALRSCWVMLQGCGASTTAHTIFASVSPMPANR